MQFSVAATFCFLASVQALTSVTVKKLSVEEANAGNYTWTVTNWAATCASANSSCSYSKFYLFGSILRAGHVLLNVCKKVSISVLQSNLPARQRSTRSVPALAWARRTNGATSRRRT